MLRIKTNKKRRSCYVCCVASHHRAWKREHLIHHTPVILLCWLKVTTWNTGVWTKRGGEQEADLCKTAVSCMKKQQQCTSRLYATYTWSVNCHIFKFHRFIFQKMNNNPLKLRLWDYNHMQPISVHEKVTVDQASNSIETKILFISQFTPTACYPLLVNYIFVYPSD